MITGGAGRSGAVQGTSISEMTSRESPRGFSLSEHETGDAWLSVIFRVE